MRETRRLFERDQIRKARARAYAVEAAVSKKKGKGRRKLRHACTLYVYMCVYPEKKKKNEERNQTTRRDAKYDRQALALLHSVHFMSQPR